MYRAYRALWLLCVIAPGVQAQSFCVALAETYYEQVYCQLQARAQHTSLPPFHEFKKNNEQVQFSLLKRPAQRNAITLPPPQRPLAGSSPAQGTHRAPAVPNPGPQSQQVAVQADGPVAVAAAPVQHVTAVQPVAGILSPAKEAFGECYVQGVYIHCAQQRYDLQGNQRNSRLRAGALEAGNRMELPAYQGQQLAAYLAEAYAQYIDKMCGLGLCGVTMSYHKFSYLYGDIQGKGLDFSQRFETMFGFLKKDKATMAVSEGLPNMQGLSLNNCQQLNEQYITCVVAGRNLVFVRH